MTFRLFFVILIVMENNFIKVTNATYKLLDFFPDSEPLKNKAKEKALAILENLTLIYGKDGWVSIKTCLPAGREKAAAQLLDDIEILESYLKLGKRQGWIDNINFLILIKEYGLIGASLRKQMPNPNYQIPNKFKIINPKQIQNINDQNQKSNTTLEVGNKHGEKYSDRQKKILQMLSEREKVQVRDIIKEIPSITKRTIRRDLDDLLKKGKVVRVGEWNQVFYQIKERVNGTEVMS